MYFPESDAIVREHPDLRRVTELIDERLSAIYSNAPLRPSDFGCAIGADENQVTSVFQLLARHGVLQAKDVVECKRCQNLMCADAFRDAIEDEDEFECSSCGRPFRRRTEPIIVYRMTTRFSSRQKPEIPIAEKQLHTNEEPLGERAPLILVAMLELGAIDCDTRRSTEEIVVRALGNEATPNSLKTVMADLNTRQLIETKTGRSGGCWLTPTGKARAVKLRDQ